MAPRFLILETSQRLGVVALTLGGSIVGQQALDESRRHARDLAPAVQALLRERGWHARDLDGVIVSRGPGSYTGLRVGIMSAKMLAYATGCVLLAIDTFEAIYVQSANAYPRITVIADAQQDKIYVQRFGQDPEPITILTLEVWLRRVSINESVVTGPGLEAFVNRLPASIQVLPPELWYPQMWSLLQIGLRRFENGERDDPFLVEPLYLRPSSAEEKWQALGR